VLLTALWGFQQVTIKLIAADVSLVMQAALRSMVATALVLAWSGFKRHQLFERDGTLGAGIAAGLLFAFEFVFIYAGLWPPTHRACRFSSISRRRSPRSACTSLSRASAWAHCSGAECWWPSSAW
jgi:drug/metabolite transporter (DMT)-like permease